MRRIYDKIMFDAMISQSCANFLSDVDIKPGRIQSGGALDKYGDQRIRFPATYDRWSMSDVRPGDRGSLIAGAMRRDRFAERATLNVEYKWFRYSESKDGRSTLTLWDKELPAAICAGVKSGQHHLLDLVDFSEFKPLFFVRANPVIHSLKNVSRMRRVDGFHKSAGTRRSCSALLVSMKDDWSRDHWGYWTPKGGYRSTMDNP